MILFRKEHYVMDLLKEFLFNYIKNKLDAYD